MADTNRTEVPTAWLIRAGSNGEREDFVLGHGLAFGDWGDLPDLSGVSSRGEMKDMIRRLLPGKPKMSVANYSGQLWALRAHVRMGDLVVLPRKKTRQIAIGVVTREYWYRNDPDPGRRHVVEVDWRRTDVPWEAAHEDLRNSLSLPPTICAIKCDDAAQRLHELMTTRRDPGTPNRSGAMTPNDRMTPSGLHAEFLAALSDLVVGHSDLGVKPLELEMQGSLPLRVRVYMYNATRPPGGRPAGEYKIQPHCAESGARTARQTSTSRTAEQCSSSATRLRTPCSSSGTLAPTETFPIPGTYRSSPRQSWPPSPAGSDGKSEGCDRGEG